MKSSLNHSARCAGMTVVEVTVAMLILGLSSATILRFVAAVDRVRGRAVQVAAATRAAQNEAEQVRRTAAMLLPVNDTVYTDQNEGLEVEVRRTVIRHDEDEMPAALSGVADTLGTTTVQIEVLTALQDSALVRFRMLQGYEK